MSLSNLLWGKSHRRKNLRVLKKLGFQVADNLPTSRLEAGRVPKLRPTRDIFGRLMALKTLWLWVDTHPDGESEETITEMLNTGSLRRYLTPDEVEILELSRADAESAHGHLMGWKNENCWSLAWVLGFPIEPSVEIGQVAGELGRQLMLEWLPNNSAEIRALSRSCKPRAADEVDRLEDLFYCAHNAVRSAQLGSDTVPASFHPVSDGGCVHERRHSLTWVLSPGVSWEETDLDT